MTAAERIRQKMLGAQARESMIEVDGETYLLVAPSVRQASRIVQRAMKGDLTGGTDGATIDQAELQVQAVIECVRDDATKAPVFTQADREALLDSALSPEFMALVRAAVDLVNPNPTAKKKTSEETTSAPVSSP